MAWSVIPWRLLAVFMLSSVAAAAAKSKDYCGIAGCGTNHIACHNTNGSYSKSCPTNRRIVNAVQLKSLIVDLHNAKRNEIAAGNKKFLPAARMGEMVWDKELAKMAKLQVKTCDLKSDKCRALLRYRYSGQNNALYTYTRAEETYDNAWLVRHIVNNWLSESQNVTMSLIKMYPRVAPKLIVGHFTVIVAESNNAVGCAAIRFRRKAVNTFMFTCNYATTNLIGRSIYRWSDVPASECKTGRSSKYRNLCSRSEVYDNVNP